MAVVVTGLAIIGAVTEPNNSDDTATSAPGTTLVTGPPSTAPATENTWDPAPSTASESNPTTPSATAPTTSPPTTILPSTAPTGAGADTGGPVATTRWVLGGIPIKGRAPKTGYERSQFGSAWSDDVSVSGGHNGCDTRNDILQRDLTQVTFKPGTRDCVVLTGVLWDPYTARVIDFTRGRATSSAVQIDHVVALSDAWQKGAQQLTVEQRRSFANDPLNLLAVDGPTNMSKGAGDAATWLPANKAFRCRYVALQTFVKARYHLWMTRAEHEAIGRILSGCTDAQVGAIG